ncbi:MAG TPA: hypothetical protein ENL06_02145 [Candidatus Portnoybacteria bacterium]|nr:hypothetical protein [Candidatus Portnoybacteria bacterium]
MIQEKYLRLIKEKINNIQSKKDLKFFIFGSSLKGDHFGDIDIGVMGDIQDKEIRQLKEEFENSNLPYFVDLINFNQVSKEFRDNVFQDKILWIRH